MHSSPCVVRCARRPNPPDGDEHPVLGLGIIEEELNGLRTRQDALGKLARCDGDRGRYRRSSNATPSRDARAGHGSSTGSKTEADRLPHGGLAQPGRRVAVRVTRHYVLVGDAGPLSRAALVVASGGISTRDTGGQTHRAVGGHCERCSVSTVLCFTPRDICTAAIEDQRCEKNQHGQGNHDEDRGDAGIIAVPASRRIAFVLRLDGLRSQWDQRDREGVVGFRLTRASLVVFPATQPTLVLLASRVMPVGTAAAGAIPGVKATCALRLSRHSRLRPSWKRIPELCDRDLRVLVSLRIAG